MELEGISNPCLLVTKSTGFFFFFPLLMRRNPQYLTPFGPRLSRADQRRPSGPAPVQAVSVRTSSRLRPWPRYSFSVRFVGGRISLSCRINSCGEGRLKAIVQDTNFLRKSVFFFKDKADDIYIIENLDSRLPAGASSRQDMSQREDPGCHQLVCSHHFSQRWAPSINF